MRRRTLDDYGYPRGYSIDVDTGGGDGYEAPQEALSPRTCESCRRLDKDWVCPLTGGDKDPDNDTCDQIDYKEEWLDSSYGFRSPVRCEYDSDEDYKQACEAIKAINKGINDEYDRP